jgi:hypothetical protein
MRETDGGARVIHIDERGDAWIRGGGHASREGERGGEQRRMPGHAALLSVPATIFAVIQKLKEQYYCKNTLKLQISSLCNS